MSTWQELAKSRQESTARSLNVNQTSFGYLNGQQSDTNLLNSSRNSDMLNNDGDLSLSKYRQIVQEIYNNIISTSSPRNLQSIQKQSILKRLFWIEHKIEHLLTKTQNRQYSISNKTSDNQKEKQLMEIINQKQNQIARLEIKIKNLEQNLGRQQYRENQLETQIIRLRTNIKNIDSNHLTQNTLKKKSLMANNRFISLNQVNDFQQKFEGLARIILKQIQQLSKAGIKLQYEGQIRNLIQNKGLNLSIVDNIITIYKQAPVTVEVPISDSRTKHLLYVLTKQLKKLIQKFPKLQSQIDQNLQEFCSQEILDQIQVDQIDKIAEIVRYVPDIVKVQNVYNYDRQKRQRKIQFHLRIFIKVLLSELQRIKIKTGEILSLDEGIVNMIKAQIINVVNIDDILKVFRVVPKIVEVQKIVQKIVQRVIEVPLVVETQKIVQKIIEVPQIKQVQKIIHVPVQIVKYVDVETEKIVKVENRIQRVIEVPKIIEKIVEKKVEVPKIITQQIIVQKIIQVQVPTIVEKIIHIPQIQIKQVQVIIEKLVTVQKIVQKLVPVEVVVEKIVQQTIQIPKIIPIQIRNDIMVKQVEVVTAQVINNYIQRVPQIIQLTNHIPVPIIQTVQKIVEVPKIIQKIVQIEVEKPIIKEVKVIQQKIVYQDRVVEIEKVINHEVQVIKEVQKIVDRIIQTPVFYQTIIKVPQIITNVVVERVEVPHIVIIQKFVDKIIEVPKILQIQQQNIVYVNQEVPVKIVVEKIVQVPKIIERIKQIRVTIQKIVTKNIEIPKVIQIQKVVEKSVVIPKVVQKIVQVPVITQRVVEKIIQQSKLIQVQKIVEIPMFRDQIIKIQRQNDF